MMAEVSLEVNWGWEMEKLKEEKKKEQERGVDRWLLHKILLYHLIIFSLLDKICFTYVMQMTLCQT